MGQVTSQDAEALESAYACVKSIMRSQSVQLDIGKERATCTLRAEIQVPSNPCASAWRLWTGSETSASFMDSQIDAPQCDRKPYVVSHDGGIFLIVPPTRTFEPSTFSLTLYIQTPLAPHQPTAPWAVQIPVLRCSCNTFDCTFYGYDAKPMVHITNPPLHANVHSSDSEAKAATNTNHLHGTFPEADIFGMEWMYESDVCTNDLHSSSAQVNYMTDAYVMHLWSESHMSYMPFAVVDMNIHISLFSPYTQDLSHDARLRVRADTNDPALAWDVLTVRSNSTPITLDSLPSFLGVDTHNMPALSAGHAALSEKLSSHSVEEPHSRTLALSVNRQLVCGAFGSPPTHAMRLLVRGRISVPMENRSNAPSIVLPSVHLPFDHVSHSHTIRHAVNSQVDRSYAIEIVEPLTQSPELRNVSADHARIVHAEHCVIRFLPKPTSDLISPMPLSLNNLSVLHQVYLQPEHTKCMHRLLLRTDTLAPGTYAVCILPNLPHVLKALEHEHAVHLYEEPSLQLQETTPRFQHVENTTNSALACRNSICMVVDEPQSVHVVVQYETPLCSNGLNGYNIMRPLFLDHVSTYKLHILDAKKRHVLWNDVSGACAVSGDDVPSVTWLDMPRRTAKAVSFTWAEAPKPRPISIIHIVSTLCCFSMAVALMALLWARAAHMESQKLHIRVEALAMALDIDFSDGQWKPPPASSLAASPTPTSHPSWIERLQAHL